MAELVVELECIRRNTAAVATLLSPLHIDLVAVTKVCLGDPDVGGAMLAGGAVALADTRDANLRRLRAAHPDVELHRIYLPPASGGFEPGDICYVSSVAGAAAVAASVPEGGRRGVMLMLETGDHREGATVEGLGALATAIAADERVELVGVATNYACFQGEPEGIRASVEAVCAAARRMREQGHPVPRVSAGSSSVLALVRAGTALPPEVTELRCGEALLLGQDALLYERLPGCRQDACRLLAPVLERYTKQPAGTGWSGRLILGLGHQDLGRGAVRFVDPRLHEIGRSSDYLIVGVEAGGPEIGPGGSVEMVPSYTALMAAWTSPFVEVRIA